MNVLVDIDRIGLVIWGVQSGHRVFCSNAAIPDPQVPEIKATWGDIRKLVVVNNFSVVFYALEFSQNYKVFTVYRPVNDFGRSGAYIAVTIYVPHNLKLHNIREILESISQAYLSDHYSFGEPLNVPENIYRYQQMLVSQASLLSLDDEFRLWRESEQNHLTKLLPFNDPSVVDAFFSTPYREDFAPYQEIMFWNLNYLQNPAQFGITFLRELERFELNGVDVSAEYQGDSLAALTSFKLSYFKRNNVDCLDSYFKKGYYGQTRISFELYQNSFYQPISFDGTVDDAVRRGFLIKTGKSYGWRSSIRFEPIVFHLHVQFSGLESLTGILKAGIDERSLYEVRNGAVDLDLKGEEVQFQKTLVIEELGLRRKVKSFIAEELPQSAGRYVLAVESLHFVPLTFVMEGIGSLPTKVNCRISGFEGVAALDPRTMYGLILMKDQDSSQIEFSVPKHEIRIEGDKIVLKRTYVSIRIVLPSAIESGVISSGGRFGIRDVSGGLEPFKGLETEFPYESIPKDRSIKLYYFPGGTDTKFLFDSLEINESSEGIVITPRMMKVENRDRVDFWLGSKVVSGGRPWISRGRTSYPYIPEASEFSSDDDGFQFKIEPMNGYSILRVSSRTAMVESGKEVGTVLFNNRIISVTGRDKESDGIYVIHLPGDILLYLPFPYDSSLFNKLSNTIPPGLSVTHDSDFNYCISQKKDREKTAGKSGVKSGGGRPGGKSDVSSGGWKSKSATKDKNIIELPAWTLKAVIGAALLALLLCLWFIFFNKGSQRGNITFEVSNHEYKDIPVTITHNPKYTKANGSVLTIYRKYEKKYADENKRAIKLEDVTLSFGEKKGGEYSDGETAIDGNTWYPWESGKEYKTAIPVEIPSIAALEIADGLDAIASVLKQFENSNLIAEKAIEKAKSIVEADLSQLDGYEKLFGNIDKSSFIKDKRDYLEAVSENEKAINAAKDDLLYKLSVVRSMNCTSASVQNLESSLTSVLGLGVSEAEVNKLCKVNCRETIKYFKIFFSSLDHDQKDIFESKLGISNGNSQILNSYFSKEQKTLILRKLLKGSSSYQDGQKLYKGDYASIGIPRQTSFAGLDKNML